MTDDRYYKHFMAAKLIRSFYNVTPDVKGGVITLGNFDGVHLGHQALVHKVLTESDIRKVPHIVVTFEPHPFEFFDHNHLAIPRLTRLREKFQALRQYGVKNVLILKFNQLLAKMDAESFVDQLYAFLQPTHIVTGDDFRFGYKRQGDAALLARMGRQLGFSVETLPTLIVENERVSSTRVRSALADSDHALVKQLLGRSYTMQGRVRHGDKQGRVWGFPTANIFLHRKLTPVSGVYTVFMHGIMSEPLPGVANVGIRPTVGGTRSLLEVHLLNFDQEIYGRYVEVEFCEKLREELHYPNIELLKAQIAKDVVVANQYFKNNGVL